MASCPQGGDAVARSPSSSSRESAMERLWKDYFRDPSLWWDNRRTKTNPRSPDFKHKLTKESLWMDGRHNPSWVTADSLTIKRTEEPCVIKAMRKAQDATQERLSLTDALASLEAEKPSDDDLASILRSCTKERNRTHALRLDAYMRKHGLEADPSLGNHLLAMLVEVGSMPDAQQVFDRLIYRNESSWNSLITGYAKRGELQHALILYQQIQEDDSVHLSGHTFVALLKVCAKLRELERGREIHADVARKGLLKRDLFVGSSLVDMYAKCGSLVEAQEVFDKLPVRNVVLWTSLIAGYSKHGCGKEALHCFEQMHLDGVSPDAVTFVCSLKACGNIGGTDKGQEIHAEIAKKGLAERDVVVGNTLVDMYAKCGSLAIAQQVFDKLQVRNIVSWNSLITGYAHLGESGNVFRLFDRMLEEGVKPVPVTFIIVLNACSRRGLFNKSQMYFEAMSKDYGIIPALEHHTCMVDLLSRAGQLHKAVAIIKKMPFCPNLAVWHSVLGACRNWGNVELGKEAFEHALHMQLQRSI